MKNQNQEYKSETSYTIHSSCEFYSCLKKEIYLMQEKFIQMRYFSTEKFCKRYEFIFFK